jgi:NfeD-like C-terminal, partner-binding
MELLNQLEPLLRTFWYVAIPTSLIFLLQTILTFVGGHHGDGFDGGGGFDAHTSGHDDGFHLFSFRNLINFLLGFSWTGISLYALVSSSIALIIIALGVGVGFVWLFFFLIKQLQRLAEDNTFQLTDTLGKEVEVYLKIPANRQGKGKVLVSARGAIHELEAVTDGPEIASNAKAKVVEVDGETLIVELL